MLHWAYDPMCQVDMRLFDRDEDDDPDVVVTGFSARPFTDGRILLIMTVFWYDDDSVQRACGVFHNRREVIRFLNHRHLDGVSVHWFGEHRLINKFMTEW